MTSSGSPISFQVEADDALWVVTRRASMHGGAVARDDELLDRGRQRHPGAERSPRRTTVAATEGCRRTPVGRIRPGVHDQWVTWVDGQGECWADPSVGILHRSRASPDASRVDRSVYVEAPRSVENRRV